MKGFVAHEVRARREMFPVIENSVLNAMHVTVFAAVLRYPPKPSRDAFVAFRAVRAAATFRVRTLAIQGDP